MLLQIYMGISIKNVTNMLVHHAEKHDNESRYETEDDTRTFKDF